MYELDRGIAFISTSRIISLVVSKSVTESHNFTTSMHSRQDGMRNYKQVVHCGIGSSAATHFSGLVLYFTLVQSALGNWNIFYSKAKLGISAGIGITKL